MGVEGASGFALLELLDNLLGLLLVLDILVLFLLAKEDAVVLLVPLTEGGSINL